MAINPEQGGPEDESLYEQIAEFHLAMYLLFEKPVEVQPAESEPKPELVVTDQDTEEYGVNVD